MRYYQLLEKRKNPELNPRTDINQELLRLNQNNNGDMYVSFTEIPKLGINPTNQFNTPTGIYSYPLRYVASIIEKTGSIHGLEFAHERPYAWVFRLNGNKLSVTDYSNGEIDREKLQNLLDIKNGHFNIPNINTISELFSEIQFVARHLTQNKEARKTLTSSIMYKVLGYDYCEDYGTGTIHTSEPYQCVVYNPKAIAQKKMLNNGFGNSSFKINITKNQTYTTTSDLLEPTGCEILGAEVSITPYKVDLANVLVQTRTNDKLSIDLSINTKPNGKCFNIKGRYTFHIDGDQVETQIDIPQANTLQDIIEPIIVKSKMISNIRCLGNENRLVRVSNYEFVSFFHKFYDDFIEFKIRANSETNPERSLIAKQKIENNFTSAEIYCTDPKLDTVIENRFVTSFSDLSKLLQNAEHKLLLLPKENKKGIPTRVAPKPKDNKEFDDFVNGK